MNQATKGRLIWESPTGKPAPAFLVILLGVLFAGLGLALFDPLFKNFRTVYQPWSNIGVQINIGLIVFLVAFGIFLIYSGIYPKMPKGVEFFEVGLEFGQGSKRKFVKYSDLAVWRLDRVGSEKHQRDKTIAVAAGVVSLVNIVSLVSMNASGIGYAVGTLMAEKVCSLVVVKPRDEKEFQIPLYREDEIKLEPLFSRRV